MVLLILSEVRETSINGGQLSLSDVKRDKPQFIVMARNEESVRKAIVAVSKTLKHKTYNGDEYEVTKLHAADDEKLQDVARQFIEQEKQRRSAPRKTPRTFDELNLNIEEDGMHY